MNIQEIRQKYPQYKDRSDDELAQALHKKYYADRISYDEFKQRIGLQPTTPAGTGYGTSLTEEIVKSSPQAPEGSLIDSVIEPLKSIGGAIAGTSWGGYKGIAELIRSGDLDSAVNVLKQTQQDFASMPETEAGKRGLEQVTKAIGAIERGFNAAAGGTAGLLNVATNPYSNVTQGFQPAIQESQAIINQGLGKAAGQEAFDVTGSPLLATATEVAPDVAGIIVGSKTGKILDGTPERQVPSLPQDDLISAGRQTDVPLMTSDVFQPSTYMGRWTQSMSEKLGVLGTGSARRSQQVARENAVQQLADEFDVSLDSPFFSDVINSLTAKNARKLELANMQRRKAIDALSPYGEVPFNKTQRAVLEVINKEKALGAKANQGIINEAESYLDALSGRNFDEAAAIRTRLIQAQKDLESSTSESKTPLVSAYGKIKQAIDEDLNTFAKESDRDAAAQWLNSNRNLAEQLSTVKQTELKRMIEKGDIKPEVVSSALFGGKRSELQRLARSLGDSGRNAARAAIVRHMLDKSGFFTGDVNPNKFLTELNRTNNKQAIDILFSDNQKLQLDALGRVLEATRRAQDAGLATRTGEQLVPLMSAGGVGFVGAANPLLALGTVGTLSGALKAYESKPMRQLLMRIARTKKGSAEEKRILENAIPAVLAAQMAAIEQQQIDLVAGR